MLHKLAANALYDGKTALLVHKTAAWSLTELDTLRKRNNDGGNGPDAR